MRYILVKGDIDETRTVTQNKTDKSSLQTTDDEHVTQL